MLAIELVLCCTNELEVIPHTQSINFFPSLSLFSDPKDKAQLENHIGDEL